MTSKSSVGRGVRLVLCRGDIDRSTDGTRAEGGDVCMVGFGRVVRSVDRLRDGSDWYFPSFRTEG